MGALMASWPCEDCKATGIVPTCPRCGIGTKSRHKYLLAKAGIKKKSGGMKARPANAPKPISESKRTVTE
jgi:hypothetical protein